MFKKAQKLKEEIELLLREKSKLEGELDFLMQEWNSLVTSLNIRNDISKKEIEEELEKLNKSLKEFENELNTENFSS